MSRNWKIGILFFSAAILIAVIVCCVAIRDSEPFEMVKFETRTADGISQIINLCYDEGSDKHYAFLPSYADLDTLSVHYNSAAFSCFLDGKKYRAADSFSDIQTDREYLLEFRDHSGKSVFQTGLIFMKGDHVPALSISLSKGTLQDLQADRDNSRSGRAMIIREDQTVDFAGFFSGIHSRGHSSWKQAKKSFTLNFSENVEPLGMKAGKSWILLADSFDESSLRNKLVYDTAKDIGVDFAVDSRYVDLYIDDNYQGLYLLTEKVEVGENRVDIDDLAERTQALNRQPLSVYPRVEETEDQKIQRSYEIPYNPDDITGGYLLETAFIERQKDYPSMVYTDDLLFTLVSPKYASEEQIAWLSEYLNEVECRLRSSNLSDLDLLSFAKYYLIQELFANRDTGSVFFYKDSDRMDGRLHACSIWDFDLSIGSGWLESGMNPCFLYRNGDNWFQYLVQNEQFLPLVSRIFETDILPRYSELIDQRLDEYAKLIDGSFRMDKVRWRGDAPYKFESDLSQTRFDTLREHIDYIKNYMKQRTDFLESVWIDGEDYYRVSFVSNGENRFRRYCSVLKGDTLDENPVPDHNEETSHFLGWFDAEGNEYVPGRIITRDENYRARWEFFDDEETEEPDLSPEKPETFLSQMENYWWSISEEQHFKLIGLGIIGVAVLLFIISDWDCFRKSRRAGHGQN